LVKSVTSRVGERPGSSFFWVHRIPPMTPALDMALTYCFEPHHPHIHLTAAGAHTLTDWQDSLARLAEEASSEPRMPILLDFVAGAHTPRDWEIPLLAYLLRRLVDHRRCRLAIHSAEPEHGVALAMLAFSVCVRPGAFLTDRNGVDCDAGLCRNGDHYAPGRLVMVTMTMQPTQRAARQQVSTA